jgi:hypothetical protein
MRDERQQIVADQVNTGHHPLEEKIEILLHNSMKEQNRNIVNEPVPIKQMELPRRVKKPQSRLDRASPD